MCELAILNEGNGGSNFNSLLSFLPSRIIYHSPSLSILPAKRTYSLWNNVLVAGIVDSEHDALRFQKRINAVQQQICESKTDIAGRWLEMVKVLIVYDSRSGNTKKMAREIAEGVKTVKHADVIVKKVVQTSLDDLVGADGIIMGSPTYYGLMSGRLKALIDESVKVHGKLDGKVGAAFTSSGGVASGAETTLLSIVRAMLVHGMIIQGRSDSKHYGSAAVGRPEEDEIKSCRDLGRRVANLAVKLVTK